MTKLRHPARERSSVASIALLLVLSLLLGACATTGGSGGVPGESRAERLAANGDHDDAARVYIGLAAEASELERDRLTLLAVEQWLDAGDADRASNAFRAVPMPGGSELRQLWNTNSAALSLYAGDADTALDILDAMSRQPLSERYRLRVEALRADGLLTEEAEKWYIEKAKTDEIGVD